jgi:penicillin-binding protein 1C
MPGRRARLGLALAAIVVAGAGLGIPGAFDAYERSLGPLDLTAVAQTSPIAVDRNGRLLRAFTAEDGRWRLPIQLEEVDPRFLSLLMAYEDHRFRQHDGVDPLALARAAVQFATRGRVVSGGSTLTMQVARLLEPREERTLSAKLRQMVRAIQIERRFSKDEILGLYLALAPYGGNLEGIRAASLSYFGKEPRRLTLGEAALLVALPQSPEMRRPDRSPDAAAAARRRVLERARLRNALSTGDLQLAEAEPVPHRRRAFPTLAAHATEAMFRATPDRRLLRTTFDAHLQASLEGLARDAAERLGPKLSVAMIAIDNGTGEVRAHVGGPDYFAAERAGSMDLALAVRSPGSALKPFIYGLAFELGIAHPETILEDRRQRFGLYAPENFDLNFKGQVSARYALQQSLNVPAIELLNEVTPARFLARLRNAGADLVMPTDAAPGLAIGIGGVGIRLTDLTRLYAGLARGGRVPELIERSDLPRPPMDRRITEPAAAWYLWDVLKGAPPPDNALGGRIAFKTGTSYGYRDAFAVGYDRRTTIGVWVGRADNGAVPGLVGRQVAAPILFDAFARLGPEREALVKPPGILTGPNAALPPPMRHLRKDVPKTAITLSGQLRIAYPPEGARVDLGLSRGSAEAARLALKAQGGAPPFTWLINGIPVGEPDLRRQTAWAPDGAGFARISVMDAHGASASVSIRLE